MPTFRRHPLSTHPLERWHHVPNSSKDVLRDYMLQMYWEGVTQEVIYLIRTLRSWRSERFEEIRGEDEELVGEDLQGFQVFVERAVGEERRDREYVSKLLL
jgi:hypothetical protein